MINLETIRLNKKDITDFSFERNKLLKSAKKDWVLFLDSDEELDRPVTDLDPVFDAYRLTRKNYFLNIYVGKEDIVRLAKKDAGKWYRKVHEFWDIPSNKIGKLDSVIIHNTANDLSSYLKKINFYSDLHAKANLKEGKKSNIIKIILYPAAKFMVTYFKSRSVVFSIMQSLHSFLSWTKLYFLQH